MKITKKEAMRILDDRIKAYIDTGQGDAPALCELTQLRLFFRDLFDEDENEDEKLLKEVMTRRYPMEIFPVEDEGEEYYFAFLPDFGSSACNATGYTIAEALETLDEVKREVVLYYIEEGKKIPEPKNLFDEDNKEPVWEVMEVGRRTYR